MQRAVLLLAVLATFLLPAPATSCQSHLLGHLDLRQDLGLAKPSEIYWRPITPLSEQQQQPVTLFGALSELGRITDQERLLQARGLIRSFQFQYKSFSYERDFFNVYKGVTLRKFLDGVFDIGVYKHQLQQGNLFGPSGAPPPARNRLELMLRWNLGR